MSNEQQQTANGNAEQQHRRNTVYFPVFVGWTAMIRGDNARMLLVTANSSFISGSNAGGGGGGLTVGMGPFF